MIIRSATVGIFEENCWMVVDEASRDAVLIDPGDEAERLLSMLDREHATLKAIWLTHAHLDHVGAIAEIMRERPAPIYLHPDDRVLYDNVVQSGLRFDLHIEQPPPPDHALNEGDVVHVGNASFTVWHVPGHAPGHVVFIGDGVCFGGDCLFAGSVGRTDLPFSNPADFHRSLQRLSTLPDELTVLPGHGPSTTIARERATNPFLLGLARPVGA